MAKTEIFIMTHKKFDPPKIEGYVPLQVGRALNDDLGYMDDASGENISDLNPYYGELTGLFWLWQNYHDCENIGICHYRRYFTNKEKRIMTIAEYESLLRDNDIISSFAVNEEPYRESYAKVHNIKDLMAMRDSVAKLYPEDVQAFDDMLDAKRISFGNLFVTKKEIFDAYCEWLFTIFTDMGDHIDLSGYDAYHKRLFGFLSETMIPVFAQTRGLKVAECKVSIVAEKAETVELKKAVSVLVKERRIKEAADMYVAFVKLRPDVLLEHSDLKHEIPLIEVIISTLMDENKASSPVSLYDVSDDMDELFRFLKAYNSILLESKCDIKAAESEKKLVSRYTVSEQLKRNMDIYNEEYVRAYVR